MKNLNDLQKNYLVHAVLYALAFNILPLFLSETTMGTMLMYGYPILCLVLTLVFVKMMGAKLLYFLVAPVCYLPSPLILQHRFTLYASEAYTYIAIIVLFTFIGFIGGWMFSKSNSKDYKNDLRRFTGRNR